MASVSSLDNDLRKLRLDKYTPAAANEARSWIESVLGERLPPGDLLESLKDGVALCRLVNLALPPPGVKFKQSNMPFVQMENISHFLRACQTPPLNLQEHDMFLTVDLYESKDPAQVLQCLGAFSRAAHAINPTAFPTAMGPKSNRGVLSPQSTGGPRTPTPTAGAATLRNRGSSNASNTSSAYGARPAAPVALAPSKTGDSASGRWSPTKSPTKSPTNGTVSSWSKKDQEGVTAPAWNIAQYGYMGGASQGNLGISFGGRRQITSAGPYVPNMAEKEKRRKEEEERQRKQMEEEARQKAEIEAEEARAREEEERRWAEETRRLREEEKRRQEEEKRRWEEEERQWKLTEEKRRREEEEAEARLQEERLRARSRTRSNTATKAPTGGPQLHGQFLSQYQAEHGISSTGSDYSSRVKELERELELARQREAEYERERQERNARMGVGSPDDDNRGTPVPATTPIPSALSSKARARSRSRPRPPAAEAGVPTRQDSWSRDEREVLSTKWNQNPSSPPTKQPPTQQHSYQESPQPVRQPPAQQHSYQESPQPVRQPPPQHSYEQSPHPVRQPPAQQHSYEQSSPQPVRAYHQDAHSPSFGPPQPVRAYHQDAPSPSSFAPRPLPDPRTAAAVTSPTAATSPTKPVKTHRTGGDGGEPSPSRIKTHRTGDGPNKLVKAQRTGDRDRSRSPTKVATHNTGGGRPLPDPQSYATPTGGHRNQGQSPSGSPFPVSTGHPERSTQQLPAPRYTNNSPFVNRTDRYLARNPPPVQPSPSETYSREVGSSAERDAEDRRRREAAQRTRQGGWASKSLLEREMELERQRQREWEESQRETSEAVSRAKAEGRDLATEGVDGIGGGIGGRWDVSQWSGYAHGDSQNRGSQGIGAGRRQIVGPRPLPGPGGR